MDFNRWWDSDASERYWLEVTDRSDLGHDLHAPQRRSNGTEHYGYSLIREIRNGDIVFHYHKGQAAIVAASRAAGGAWEDKVVWAAHGTVARNAGVQPFVRPGWLLGLDAFQTLNTPVTLDDLRLHRDEIQAVRVRLEGTHHDSVYSPFESSEKRDLRPAQAYITKLPAAVVRLFPALTEAAQRLERAGSAPVGDIQMQKAPTATPLGAAYRSANEELAVSERDPFTVDPALVERANRGHAATQNVLAAYLASRGVEPRSPASDEPNYDLAWTVGEVVYVAEVKSLTNANEEKQLRLGLGQLLRYRQLLGKRHALVRAILMAEREPQDTSWAALCHDLGVKLVWPACVQSLD